MGKAREDIRLLSSNILARKAAFRSEYLDFDRGIRVGHLAPEERITQILKSRLAEKHGIRFLCDRWGRGVYWQWICWVPEPNRKAKPVSASYNFSSAKFFVAIDRDERIFQSGMQVERAPRRPSKDDWPLKLEKDWDWHVLLRALGEKELPSVLRKLLGEGFRVRAGPFSSLLEYDRKSWDVAGCRRKTRAASLREWGVFQLFYAMSEKEVGLTPGAELIDAIVAALDEVVPAMNLCMSSPCLRDS